MADADDDSPDDDARAGDQESVRNAEEIEALRTELDSLNEDLAAVEDRLDEKTVSRSELEADLKQYVRKRSRRGHARGWGPYLVLLYGTAMTLGAFLYLDGVWAVLSMIVVWLSTLGLYVVMVLAGMGLNGLALLGGLRDVVGKIRR